MSWLIPLLLLLLVSPLVVGLLRISELFVVRARAGKLALVRGRIPPALLRDLGDILRAASIRTVELRAVIEDGRARLYAHGAELPDGVKQQLRNTISLWPVAKIRHSAARARAPRRP